MNKKVFMNVKRTYETFVEKKKSIKKKKRNEIK